jgi:hypothetical protein
MATADSILAWVAEYANSGNVDIWVDEPTTQLEKGFLGGKKEYTTYRLVYKTSDSNEATTTRYRYSEFESMRLALKERYSHLGIFVPKLPGKKVIGSNESGFVKERMRGISFFLRGVIDSPFLSRSSIFTSFVKTGSADNEGETMLLNLFSLLESPPTPLARLDRIKDETTVAEFHIRHVLEKLRSIHSAQKKLAEATQATSDATDRWAEAEGSLNILNVINGGGPLTGSALHPHINPTSTTAAASRYFNIQARENSRKAETGGVIEAAPFEFQTRLVDSFKELFNTHDSITSEIDSLWNKLHKLETRVAQGETLSPKAEEQRIDYEKRLEEKKTLLTCYYKGFFHVSLPYFIHQRAVIQQQALQHFSVLTVHSSVEQKAAGCALMDDLKSAPSASHATANMVLVRHEMLPLSEPEGFGTINFPAQSQRNARQVLADTLASVFGKRVMFAPPGGEPGITESAIDNGMAGVSLEDNAMPPVPPPGE